MTSPADPSRPNSPPDASVAATAARLRSEISEHNRRYHTEDAPIVSDAEYDELVRALRALEAEHPELADDASPTARVGAAPSATFAEVVHRVPMMSLDNAFSPEELVAWGDRVAKRLAVDVSEPVGYCGELKIDGVAISLRYEDGRLVQAATRGDGTRGEDVTANVSTIRDIPHELPADAPRVLEVRGEVYMSLGAFAALFANTTWAGRTGDDPAWTAVRVARCIIRHRRFSFGSPR